MFDCTLNPTTVINTSTIPTPWQLPPLHPNQLVSLSPRVSQSLVVNPSLVKVKKEHK